MTYSYDMSQERAPGESFPEGLNECIIVNCEESISKKNNVMFVITLALVSDPLITNTVYAVAEPKKRWFLKQLLDACDLEAAKDGVYKWDIKDVLDKKVLAKVKIEEETWIDREGNNRTTSKSKVNGFVKAFLKENTENIPF